MTMCVDFTDLYATCPKNLYQLPHVNRLIDGSSGYHMLKYVYAYSECNHIHMDPLDAP